MLDVWLYLQIFDIFFLLMKCFRLQFWKVFFFFLRFLLFPSSYCWNVFVSCNLFFFFFLNSKMKYTFSDFILHTFKKFKFKFYRSTEGHTFLFWPCYRRYALLIIDKLPVEFSFLMLLLHLSLETTNRFIHPRHFFTISIQ